jgi:hypothetical protein
LLNFLNLLHLLALFFLHFNFLYLLLLFRFHFDLLLLGLLQTVGKVLVSVWVPGPDIAAETAALAAAESAVDEVRQAGWVYVLEQFLLVAAAQDVDLLLGLVVDPHLHDGPDAREEEWRVEDEHAPQDLRVVVLRHFRGRLHELVGRTRLRQLDVLEVQDGAGLRHPRLVASVLPSLLSAGWEDGFE